MLPKTVTAFAAQAPVVAPRVPFPERLPTTIPQLGLRPPRETPLRVAHIGPCMLRGGAEQHLIDLARFLDASRCVLTQCLVTDPSSIADDVAHDLPCPVILADRDTVAAALQDNDIVLFWGVQLDQWVDPAVPRRARTVYIAHGEGDWTRELLLGSRQTVDHTIAVSHRVLDVVCRDFPTSVILNGIDTARLATTMGREEMRSRFGIRPDDFVVGFVGRFSWEKRPEVLIRALSLLPPHFKAMFVGWGYMQPQLLEEANELAPNRCVFRFADRYLGDFYQAFDAFALVSAMEGFALVLLEAMFQGLPIVATPVGAVPEMIDPHISGVIVDGTAESVAGAILQLERNRTWAKGMGEAARQRAMTFGHARRMADQYADLFEQLALEPAGPT